MAETNDIEADAALRRHAPRDLSLYFALTYAITFSLGLGFIFFRPQMEALIGHIERPIESWPYYLAVCAPTISAVLLSAAFGGLAGVKRLFAGLIRPFQIRWAFIALLTLPLGLLLWGLGERALDGPTAAHEIHLHALLVVAPLQWVTTAAIFIDPGPWGEETGWRGFALPRLLSRLSPLAAALLLGLIWSVWHTPAFFVSGLSQSGLNYGLFLLGITSLSVFIAWIYVNANGNYLVAGMIPHAVNNHMMSSHVYNSLQIETALYVAIAVLIVAFAGPSLKGWRR